jgi:amino acid adenylation domain-containing protein
MTDAHSKDSRVEPTLTPVDFDPFAEMAPDAPFGLSEAQKEIWAVVQMGPEASCAYNQCFALTLRGEASLDALTAAVQKIFARHDALRTQFDALGETQTIQPFEPVDVPILDLVSVGSPDERRARVQAVFAEEVRTPLDLVNGPSARARIVVEATDCLHFVITAHHIMFDGSSSVLFFRELATLYSAELTNVEGALPPATPFRFQVDFEGSPEGHERAAAALDYWRAQFADGAPSLELPTDRARSPVKTYGGAREDLVLTKVMSPDVTRVASRLGATSVGLLLSIFQILLYRLTGQSDVVVGLPLSARDPNLGDTLMGHATNLLPMRASIDGRASFADFVRRTRTALLDGHDHQSLTFGTLVQALNLPRDMSRTPLVSALFNVDRGRIALPFGNIQGEAVSVARRYVNFELELQLVDTRRELILELAYESDLFSAESVRRWLGHYEELLAGALANPETPIDRLPLLRESDREALMAWNSTEAAYRHDVPLARLFEEQVNRTPESMAVTFGKESICYRDLSARANQLAHALIAQGIGPDHLVGICVERSIDMIVALLAIVKAGGAYVPLDPYYPRDRLAHMVHDSGLKLIVTREDLRSVLPQFTGPIVCTDDSGWRTNRTDSPSVSVQPANLAYVIYTSGSTGKPKGVRVHHEAAVNFLQSMQREPGIRADDRVLAITTLSFDIALLELVLPLVTGATIVLATRAEAMDAMALRVLVERNRCTLMQATPSTWRMLVDSGWRGVPTLKALCGGEALTPDLAEQILPRVGELWNMYGPTETTVWSTCCKITNPREGIGIGRPIANTEVWILDANRELCPIGVLGEICIGGDGVSHGYLNRPELDAERFIADRFSSRSRGRLYKTGDVGRWTANGRLQCLGRTDFQVKVRGFRIELGEIESILTSYPEVKQATVVAREDNPGDVRLVAYVISTSTKKTDVAELRQHMAASLPDYMIPQHFVFLQEFPSTPNGKIDRKALPAPTTSQAEVVSLDPNELPQSDTEKKIAAILCDVLGLRKVGRNEGFFALGGHSLTAIKAITRINQTFNLALPMRTIFGTRTCAELASVVARQVKSQGGNEVHNWATGPFDSPLFAASKEPFPLSEAQKEIWAVAGMGPEASCAYNECFVLTLRGQVSVAALKSSTALAFERHEALRTKFDPLGETQIIQPFVPIETPVLDLTSVGSADERRACLKAVIAEEVAKPLDLVRGPCARVRIIVETPDCLHLALTAHHIMFDGFSSGLFFRELSKFYSAELTNTEVELPAATPFRFQVDSETSPEGRSRATASLDYWRMQFADGAPSLELPTDRRRPPIQTYSGDREDLELTKVCGADVTRVASRLGTTSVGLLLSVFQVLLYRLTGQHDIVVGLPLSARDPIVGETLMGHATNLLPMRARINGRASFASLVNSTQTALMDAQDNQSLTFGTLVRALNLPRDMSRTPLVAVLFNVTHLGGTPTFIDSRAEVFLAARKHVNFEIELQLAETRRGVVLELAYNSDLFSRESIQRWLGHYEELLAGALANPETPIDRLPLLRDSDRVAVMAWNHTEAAYPHDVPLARLIEEQVNRTPEAIAVAFESESICYRELNARANQLAHALIARGIGPDHLVGICVERSIDMIVALLAIVKAGGAYVPLDPFYPRERLAHMVHDSGLKLIVTQEDLRPTLPEFSGPIVCTDDPGWRTNHTANPAVAVQPANLAYVIYTSGSTGKPKGVRVHHEATVNFLHSMQREPGMRASDRVLAITTLSFDIALLELVLPLVAGATIVLATRAEAMDAMALRALLERNRCTLMQATPSTWRMLIESSWPGSPALKALCGGEALTPDLAEQILPRVGELWNMYGPTETTVWSTCCKISSPREGISIGRPIANTEVWILDANRELCPIGVLGEICIGGDGVSHGYLNRPELDAERFIVDRFSSRSGRRLYKTGDLGRYAVNGQLQCLGRTDFQVKVRGFRIELGEIESVLASHPEVKQAIVVAREDNPGDVRLVAYVISTSTEEPDVTKLRQHLAASLPDYMIPQHFIFLQAFPSTPNGKIDRKALPGSTAFQAEDVSLDPNEVPQTETEKRIAAILCDVLGRPRVGRNEGFFDLGGHSLTAIKTVARINQEFGLTLPVRILFAARTCADLAAQVEPRAAKQGSAEVESWPVLVPVQAKGSRTPLFCVARPNVNALGYVFLSRHLGPDQPVYGLQSQLPEDPDVDFTPQQYEDTAREYLKAMRSVQPKGPYYVVGQCQGAYIAFEMARQVEKSGEQFGWLGILDAFTEQNTRHLSLFLAYVAWGTFRSRAARLRSRLLEICGRAKRCEGQPVPVDPLTIPAALGVPSTRRGLRQTLELYFPGKDFKPPNVASDITVFAAPQDWDFYRIRDDRMGWHDRTVGKFDVVHIPGEHETILSEPHVEVLAKEIEARLPGSSFK